MSQKLKAMERRIDAIIRKHDKLDGVSIEKIIADFSALNPIEYFFIELDRNEIQFQSEKDLNNHITKYVNNELDYADNDWLSVNHISDDPEDNIIVSIIVVD